jgi:hypothetical protein
MYLKIHEVKQLAVEGPRINLAGKGNLNIFHENYYDLLLKATEKNVTKSVQLQTS